MKKTIALVLTLALMLTLFAGCGSTAATTTTAAATQAQSGSAETTAAAAATEPAQELTYVTIEYPVMVIVPSEESGKAVEEVLNARLEELGSNTRVKLNIVDISQYDNYIDMKLIANEEVGIYCALGNMAAQVASNKCLALDSYLDGALADAVAVTGTALLGATTFNGNVYGMPVYRTDFMTEYLVIETEMANNDLGLYAGDTLTVDQVTEVLAKLHELYPDKIAMGVRPGSNGQPNNFQLQTVYAAPDYYKVSNLGSGAGIIGDELTVQNLYSSDYFYQVCKTAYDWNQAGYVNRDASVASEEGYELMKADRALSYIIGYGGLMDVSNRVTVAEKDTTHEKSVTYFPVSVGMNSPSGLAWCIPYNCANPEAAAEILGLLYTDAMFLNTLLYGVEGRDYVDTGLGTGDDKVVELPEGMTMYDVPYYAFFTCGIIGNEYIQWQRPDATTGEVNDRRPGNLAAMQTAPVSPVYGFTLNTENVKNEVTAISNVESKYLGGLYSGESDPDVVIPQFLAELEAAGINAVVAEAQAQVDAWAAENK